MGLLLELAVLGFAVYAAGRYIAAILAFLAVGILTTLVLTWCLHLYGLGDQQIKEFLGDPPPYVAPAEWPPRR